MKVLMYGWEFPPKNEGGLGTACEGIVNGLLEHGVMIHLLLPDAHHLQTSSLKIEGINSQLQTIKIKSSLKPYQIPAEYQQEYVVNKLETISHMVDKQSTQQLSSDISTPALPPAESSKMIYGDNLFEEVQRYAHEAGKLASDIEHEVIHAHDWMTYPAALKAKKISKKPLIAHIHATELDRSGDGPHPLIFEIEKLGFEYADKIIAVSEFTKRKIVQHYCIDPQKIEVVHNAVTKNFRKLQTIEFKKSAKTVLFLGRITMQKGPEYFLQAAKKVLEVEKDVHFIMAGSGDMLNRMIHYAVELGIERNILFSGFLRGVDVDRAFQSADLYVMPSVSEPFGIAALEAIKNGVPVIVSKQSGVSEVMPNMLKVDFWDTQEMANKIVMALRHDVLSNALRRNSTHDLERLSWTQQAAKIKDIYKNVHTALATP